ncbi:poly-gamma-glutamate hydrolase family protein [Dehalobacterium formicoaceticum]|uniref:Poly-gamma-glutamate hydrolase family protein n=1 Tax=Dehalobacterium formicoaceticum TaxID=51515 RepID=A0ABT1Y4C9_9FIRM|nr:poly-gamma-glutamate hydrolase family protein [Dehalobacterium formicoaceticum]MCR6544526.1 poly-gamma-glutamate hydrolase family protein [Dehalobacterium formicoaceticum]
MNKQFIKTIALVTLLTFGVALGGYAFTSGYSSFAELAAAEDPSSYNVKTSVVGSNTTILAIHGGGIERGTSELVQALGRTGKYNTYSFEGLKANDNGSLFIKAINFDEPKAVSLVNQSNYTVTVIGAAGDDEVTYVGGQNKLLAELVRLHLTTKGYNVKTLGIADRIAGVMDSNIVNKNKLFNGNYELGGVQIAISNGLRDKLVSDSGSLNNYSGAIDQALSQSWPTMTKLMNKVSKNNNYNGFMNRFNPEKKNFDKKVNKALEKGANNPTELIENVKEVTEE